MLQGKDLLATAQTGTGKTAAFSLPILHLLNERKTEKKGRNINSYTRFFNLLTLMKLIWGIPVYICDSIKIIVIMGVMK